MHRRRGLTATAIGAISLVLVVALAGGAATAKKKKVVKLTATMSGQQEDPPGDSDGTGKATFKMKKKKGKVCYDVRFSGIGDATVAHIHTGAKGVTGPPLITLFEDTAFASPQKACVRAPKSDIKAIIKRPKQYYVNVHNEEFPGGAIRGQLKKKRGGGGSSGGGGGGGGALPY